MRLAVAAPVSLFRRLLCVVGKDDLVDLVLSHCEDLDDRYKSLLNLKKKDVPLPDQFYMM